MIPHLDSLLDMLRRGDMPMDDVVAYVVKVVAQKGARADYLSLPEDVRTKVSERLASYRQSKKWIIVSNLGTENYSGYAERFLAKVDASAAGPEPIRADSLGVTASSTVSLQELLERRRAVEAEIAKIESAERQTALAKIVELMATHGLTVADVVPVGAKGRPGQRHENKVAPKYRHPQSGATWSGRGLRPRWLSEELSKGHTLADFSVDASH